jgi:hypothetical protein
MENYDSFFHLFLYSPPEYTSFLAKQDSNNIAQLKKIWSSVKTGNLSTLLAVCSDGRNTYLRKKIKETPGGPLFPQPVE